MVSVRTVKNKEITVLLPKKDGLPWGFGSPLGSFLGSGAVRLRRAPYTALRAVMSFWEGPLLVPELEADGCP